MKASAVILSMVLSASMTPARADSASSIQGVWTNAYTSSVLHYDAWGNPEGGGNGSVYRFYFGSDGVVRYTALVRNTIGGQDAYTYVRYDGTYTLDGDQLHLHWNSHEQVQKNPLVTAKNYDETANIDVREQWTWSTGYDDTIARATLTVGRRVYRRGELKEAYPTF